MNGKVDDVGRALIALNVRHSEDLNFAAVTAWIDTAFTGELVVPRKTIDSLGLSRSAAVLAGLADGTEVVLDCYTCLVEWFGELRIVEVIENNGEFALLGIGLLDGRRLEIDYPAQSVVLT